MNKRLLVLITIALLYPLQAEAFWIWTPETNKWVNPKWAVKDTPVLQLEYAMEFYVAEEYDKAIDELNKLLKHYPKAREAARAQYIIGQAQEAMGQYYPAYRSYQAVIEKYPFSELTPEIIDQQYAIGNRLLDGDDHRNKMIRTLVGAEYDVIDVFRTVIKNAPYGEHAAPSQYKIGLYLQEKRLYQEARDEFEKVINDYPDSEWSQAARYQIAMVDAQRSADAGYDQGITQSAVDEFEGFVEQYPDAELSDSAQEQISQLREKEAENNFLIARFYEKQRNFKAAKIYYSSIVEDYRNTSWAKKSLEKIRDLNNKIQ